MMKLSTLTKAAPDRTMIELEQWILSQIVGFQILFPNLVSVCRYFDRVMRSEDFSERSQTMKNGHLPEYAASVLLISCPIAPPTIDISWWLNPHMKLHLHSDKTHH